MENLIPSITQSVCNFFLLPSPPTATAADIASRKKAAFSMVCFNSDRLNDVGDVTFSTNRTLWIHNFPKEKINEESFDIFKPFENTLQVSRFTFIAAGWLYPVMRVNWANERCSMHLRRSVVISQILQLVFEKPSDTAATGKVIKPQRHVQLNLLPIDVDGPEAASENLSFYRAKLVFETLKRILHCHNDWIEVDDAGSKACGDDVLKLQVLSVATKQSTILAAGNENYTPIKCGLVCDSVTKKYSRMKTSEYLALRTNDMHLIAMHKYGLRALEESVLGSQLNNIGGAAVAVDLLSIKHSSPVQTVCNGQGKDKGASFILYNAARIETLLRAFDSRVKDGVYGKLPALTDLNFELLKEEHEWQLIYGFVCTFQTLVERCVEQIEQGICATHLILRFLCAFASVFSGYYRRTRILTENRVQLLPVLYARIYLIKAVREILTRALALIDIRSPEFL